MEGDGVGGEEGEDAWWVRGSEGGESRCVVWCMCSLHSGCGVILNGRLFRNVEVECDTLSWFGGGSLFLLEGYGEVKFLRRDREKHVLTVLCDRPSGFRALPLNITSQPYVHFKVDFRSS